ncbi:MAG: GNAT family N-acetyltransferase [Phycisphaerales bacterium]|nr:GNAT family N-acetyltransferase [Phycisphaerales bacterium]
MTTASTTDSPTFGPFEESLFPQLYRSLDLAFCLETEAACNRWLDVAGRDSVRVLTDGAGTLLGNLLAIPMGQYFGGRAAPMLGIAGVAVPPEARGRAIAKSLMEACLREGRARGFAISTLFAATQKLYRAAGYEQAGFTCALRLAASRLDIRERALQVRALSRDDLPEMKRVWKTMAAPMNGQLDRVPYIWHRVFDRRTDVATGLGIVGEGGALEGYLWYTQSPGARGERYSVDVSDLAASTPRALRRILSLLASMASTVEDITLLCGPHHPLLYVLGEQRYDLRRRDYWMTRIIDVKNALESRGYPVGIKCDLHFDINDPVFAENTGAFTLHIEDGKGHVARGGNGLIQLEIKALAPLYTGFMSPHELALGGSIKGDASQLALAACAFAGPAPSMNDVY